MFSVPSVHAIGILDVRLPVERSGMRSEVGSETTGNRDGPRNGDEDHAKRYQLGPGQFHEIACDIAANIAI